MIFVSPGRCGTTRIAEILKEKLPADEFAVTHQMAFSRLANVVGNIMYYFGQSEKLKDKLYNFIISRFLQERHLISSDPLTAMIIPRNWIEDSNVCIVQVTRNPEAFADSFFRFSRKKRKSFIAHNFIPCWQIGVLPLENILNKRIKHKYEKISIKKEKLLQTLYQPNPNYLLIDTEELFNSQFVEKLIHQFFLKSIHITQEELGVKSNQTT